jgi:hypothetical protein
MHRRAKRALTEDRLEVETALLALRLLWHRLR